MAGVFDISILWAVASDVWTAVTTNRKEQRENTIIAHGALNTAFIKTYDYLRNNQGAYIPKTELAEVWNDASTAVMKVDKNLGEMLYYKSRFWLDPGLYINLNRHEEIIELNRVMEEMEKFRLKL